VFGYWEKYLLRYGKPLSTYVDRLKTYKAKELSQFEQAMKELGIEVIHARSPQAKGRIERVFGTLQDRLVKELRLSGIKDPVAANRFLEEVFLPGYNAKFNVTPLKKADMHQRLTCHEKANLKSILARKTFRNVNNDFTVRHNNCWYQLGESQPTAVRPGDDVLMEERTNGKLYVLKNQKTLNYEKLSERPAKIIVELKRKERIGHPVPTDHPWKSGFRVKVRVPEPLISYTY
jgi:transposase InsO family protein